MTAVLHVRAFKDNYIWLIRGRTPGAVAVVDPGDAAPVLEALVHEHLAPAAILCTHHHNDHVGGVEELLERYDIPVYGPAREDIPSLTQRLSGGDRIRLNALDLEFDVIDVPGHTAGHIAYHGHGLLFCGDTLFSAGCGRLFEGTAEQLHDSLTRLAALAPDTAVYCGHEYTAANLRFALTVEPDNTDARKHLLHAQALCASGVPTLPSTVGLEQRINPFLRTTSPFVRQAVSKWAGRAPVSDVETFAFLRRWKDGYTG